MMIVYKYRYCVSEGHYGSSGICHKCKSGAVCKKPIEREDWKDLNKGVMIMNELGLLAAADADGKRFLVCMFLPKCVESALGRLLLFRCKLAKENMLVLHDYMHQPLTHCNSTCLFPWPHCSYLLLVSRWILVFYKNGQICFECAEDKTTLNIFLPSLLLLFFFVLTLPWLCILINN